VTIGARATINGATLNEGCYVGVGATVSEGAVIGSNAMVAPGAVVAAGTSVPNGQLWAGQPAVFVRALTAPEQITLVDTAYSVAEVRLSGVYMWCACVLDPGVPSFQLIRIVPLIVAHGRVQGVSRPSAGRLWNRWRRTGRTGISAA
jgi:NDP-sugar pyrophosphorylase family protein